MKKHNLRGKGCKGKFKYIVEEGRLFINYHLEDAVTLEYLGQFATYEKMKAHAEKLMKDRG